MLLYVYLSINCYFIKTIASNNKMTVVSFFAWVNIVLRLSECKY